MQFNSEIGDQKAEVRSRKARLLALFIGLLLVGQGLTGIAAPVVFFNAVHFMQTPPVIYLAAVVRVAFGLVLVRAAPGSRAPRFLRVLGFIMLIGGLLTPFVGVWAAQHILGWWSAGGPPLLRLFGGVSLALGALVVYAVARRR